MRLETNDTARICAWLIAGAAVVVLGACADETATGPGSYTRAAGVSFVESRDDVWLGDSLRLTALLTDSRGLPALVDSMGVDPFAPVTGLWMSSNPAVATVDSTGLVRSVGDDGEAFISVNVVVGNDRLATATRRVIVGPRQIMPGTKFTSVSVGGNAACAITDAAATLCWRFNHYRILGAATTTTCPPGAEYQCATNPVSLPSAPLARVALGWQHGCGMESNGTLWCWGRNQHGQLGVGAPTAVEYRSPAIAMGGAKVKAVDADGHGQTCVIDMSNAVLCFGHNDAGQTGHVPINSTDPTPARVGTFTASDVATAEYGSCATDTDHGLWCWGNLAVDVIDRYDYQMTDSAANPRLLMPDRKFTAISGSDWFMCALDSAGTPICLFKDEKPGVTVIDGAPPLVNISTSSSHACGLTTDHKLWCFGYNYGGELGRAPDGEWHAPRAVMPRRSFSMVSAGGNFESATCAIDMDGQLFCWGNSVGWWPAEP